MPMHQPHDLIPLLRPGQKIEVLLTMGAMNYPDFISRNSIVEVEGLEWPDETVVVSGHLDSWDVGQGAMDDGGECAQGAGMCCSGH